MIDASALPWDENVAVTKKKWLRPRMELALRLKLSWARLAPTN